MPYEIELERDFENGLDRYVITVEDGFDSHDADELGEWMTAAAQNPTAAFTLDATHVRPGRRAPLERLFVRIARLRQRVWVVRRGAATRAPLVFGFAGVLPVLG
jgi:hypothetical protein